MIDAVSLADAVVVSATARVRDAIGAVCARPQIIDDGEGPGRAVGRVAAETCAHWLLVVGGDHPAPCAALAARLVAAARSEDDGVAVRIDGRLQPLWALYRRAAVQGARSLTGVLESLAPREIDGAALTAEERAAFGGINTPVDLARWGAQVPGALRSS